MSVKAKFRVASITDHGNDNKQVKFNAALAGEENKSWAGSTPYGVIDMYICNPEAAKQFTVGQDVYITFEDAE